MRPLHLSLPLNRLHLFLPLDPLLLWFPFLPLLLWFLFHRLDPFLPSDLYQSDRLLLLYQSYPFLP